ncbi:Galactose oxidase [Hyphodiscus hymeniophilus]|uniref:Galactose oxidase n=1 Tax=Hyphodiscus hymeniophilus TaxID=353542 RepID=A0A9P7B098_9HELO|nr:Galactose oxidase [Hyphodiscus hymeniophilus]
MWGNADFNLPVTADSFQAGYPATNAIDGNTATFWHTEYDPTPAQLPHQVVIDLGKRTSINGFNYLPRQDGYPNGNIGQYNLELSTDNKNWNSVSQSTWLDDQSLKLVGFPTTTIRYIRLTAITEAGGRGPWTSAAEFGINQPSTNTNLGQWGPVIAFPLVPAAAFVVPNSGQVLTWSSFLPNGYNGNGNTYTATYDPSSNSVSELDVTTTNHDMFCPGISLDANGRAVVSGGDDADTVSIFSNGWTGAGNLVIPRGYQSQVTCSDGRAFTIGGSWHGPIGGKGGEIYDPNTNSWTLLSGCPVDPMLTADVEGEYRADNHGWLFGWKNGYVFQAGPSIAMNWYGTSQSGSQSAAGNRASDGDSMNGNAVMYDAVGGKILTVGGAPDYDNSPATSNAHIITIGDPNTTPSVQTIGSMSYERAFANSVILPDGTVMVTGGQSLAEPFTDTDAILTPEIWNPATSSFTTVAPHTVPRTYHSVALLMLDGRVFTSGGGMCGDCSTNHADGQIYSPAYLFNANGKLANRPSINSVSSSTLKAGATFTVRTGANSPSFAIIRYGSATHTINTDQRRIALTPTSTKGNAYAFQLPSDSGIVIPGYWMLFVINGNGVPSVASTIQITT